MTPPLSGPVAHAVRAGDGRAVRAAEHPAARLYPVPDDPAAAMLAHGRERVDRTLEAVEDVGRAPRLDAEGLVVVVVADLALRHSGTSRRGESCRSPLSSIAAG